MRIGVIGGLGAYAGVHALQLINDCAVESGAREDDDFPSVLYQQIPFRTTNSFGEGDEKVVREQLKTAVPLFSEVDKVIFACNTYNHIADELFPHNVSLRAFLPFDGLILASRQYLSSLGRHVPEEVQKMVDKAIQGALRGDRSAELREYVETVSQPLTIACTELSYAVSGRGDTSYTDTLTKAIQTLLTEEK